ncbi:MAG: sigma-70 family RNA polymerase sigma factor [Nitrospirales bacterium]|nr:sigma-70 family RNA polymerase sigma factor [Nitrospirales bacterium]
MSAPVPSPQEAETLKALLQGDEAAFSALVETYYSPLLRLAMAHVPSQAVAEEVVQETWLGVLEGLPKFEGRSSLKTWIFRILINRAKTRGIRERRYEPLSHGFLDDEGNEQPEQEYFLASGPMSDHWAVLPQSWDAATPERLLLSKESRTQIDAAIASLPPTQRHVITLRDVEGFTSLEVCNILDLTETNQRVLLHRARSRSERYWSPMCKDLT